LLEVNANGHSWGDMDDLWNHINSYNQGYQDHYGSINYIENHDEGRIIYELTEYQGFGIGEAIQKSKLGSTVLFTSLGVPLIYNGQEFGQSAPHRDEYGYPIYQPLQWDKLNTDLGQELFSHYKKLSELRKSYNVFNNGYHDLKLIDNSKKCIVYWRAHNEDEVVIVANFDNNSQYIDVEFPHNGLWYDFLNDSNFQIESNFYGDWMLPPHSAFVFVSSLPDDSLLGDVNFDGFVNVLDIVLVVGCIVGSCGLDDVSSGDYNQDGFVNVLDVVQIVNFIVNQ
jgi:1,4-alpha-glucan branching enzyme